MSNKFASLIYVCQIFAQIQFVLSQDQFNCDFSHNFNSSNGAGNPQTLQASISTLSMGATPEHPRNLMVKGPKCCLSCK